MSLLGGKARPTLLHVRVLRIVTASGEAVELCSVRCPAEGRAVPLEECLSCTEGGGIVQDRAGPKEYVSCRHAASVEATATQTAHETRAGQIMTTDVLAVRADADVELVTDLLLRRGVWGAPVVDAGGHPKGIVSRSDLLGAAPVSGGAPAATPPARRSVADVMAPGAYTIAEDASVAQAAALLAVHGVHRLPVVSDDGRVVGIVTSSDIVRWLAQQTGGIRARGGTRPPRA